MLGQQRKYLRDVLKKAVDNEMLEIHTRLRQLPCWLPGAFDKVKALGADVFSSKLEEAIQDRKKNNKPPIDPALIKEIEEICDKLRPMEQSSANYDVMQNTAKLIQNSGYGITGDMTSRFYQKEISSTIPQRGIIPNFPSRRSSSHVFFFSVKKQDAS